MSSDLSLDTALRRHFGFDEFRAGQREVIENLIAGRSAAAVFPTGGGKSLCYQLPALLLDGLTLVVSPLIALMKDQIDALGARGIAARRLDSTLSAEQYGDVMRDVRSTRLRLLYVAPERFNNERFRTAILGTRVALFAVDEAHCISEWGHNFRPDYLKLADFARLFQAERILALTATATPQVLRDIREGFAIEPECATCTGFYRPNLTLMATPVAFPDRDQLLRERLAERDSGSTIVYVTLQRTAEDVADRLRAAGFDAKPYHAGMKPEVRSDTQDWFLSSESGIVVATIAFGMGVDKPDIRYVYHYNLPKSLENFSQEIGRAGRDGENAICETMLCLDDLNVLENFAYGDTPTLPAVRKLVDSIFDEDEVFDVSYHELSVECDIRVLVVRTLLTYLELAGYLEGGTPFYSSYRFRPLAPSADILARFTGERREFLEQVFRQATKAKTWFRVAVHQAALATNSHRDRVVSALDYLGERKMLEVAVAGVRNRYRALKPCSDRGLLAESLHDRTVQREKREIARLHQVLELARYDGCHVTKLCEYFGEALSSPCGHCAWCNNRRSALVLPPRPDPTMDHDILRRALQLREQYPILDDPDLMARFLCGVTSPRLTKGKLSSHSEFGAAGHIPFAKVLKAVKHGAEVG